MEETKAEHWSWKNKMAEYTYRYKCPEDCRMSGCPSHIAKAKLQSTSDIISFTFKEGEEQERTVYFDQSEMGVIADYIDKLTAN